MKRNLFLAAFMLLCSLASGAAFGFDTMAFQMGVVGSVAFAVAPFLPTITHDFALVGCDANELAALTKSLEDAKSDLTKQQTSLKEAHREVMDKLEKGIKLDPEVQKNIDQAIAKANESATTVTDLAQKLDDIQKAAEAGPKMPLSVRGELIKSLEGENKDRHAKLISRETNSLRLTVKEIVSGGSDPSFSTGMRREPFIDSMVSMERPPLRIRNLLTTIPVTSDAIKYGKQVLRDNKARIVAEGTGKPYSNYKWEDATANIEVIAHLAKMTLQALADAPRLAAEIESEMRFGLEMAIEDELLNGDGTTGHLSGLLENATAYAVPAGMDDENILTPLDRLRVAMLQIHLAYAVPDAHVLNPINIAEIDLMRRDPDMGGGYLFSRPDGDSGVARIWRLPVVESPSMEVNTFLTGAFKYSAHLYQRDGVSVLISTENEDDFETNKATMRVETRLGLGVRRGYGLVTGELREPVTP